MRRSRPIAAFDTLGCLLLVFLVVALAERPDTKTPSIKTSGQYAVIASWDRGNVDDIDEYVQDPQGNVVWFGGANAGLMHLEHDDLGDAETRYPGEPNVERVIIRQALPGEYVANVHMYMKNQAGPTRVTVQLWSLIGVPRVLTERTVTLSSRGDERTAFRFAVQNGRLVSRSELPKKLVADDNTATTQPQVR